VGEDKIKRHGPKLVRRAVIDIPAEDEFEVLFRQRPASPEMV
jgi:hypothetical protein